MTYTMHMVEHVVLSQIVPIGLIWQLGTRDAGRGTRPAAGVCWIIGVATTIALALPAVFAALQSGILLTWSARVALVIGGCVFWLPVWRCLRSQSGAMSRGAAVVYLVTACFASTLVGASIAFHARTTDEQVAGLIMWVPCCLIYLSAVLAVVSTALRARPAARVTTD